MPKCRVKLRAVVHYEHAYWITLGQGGYADTVSPEEAAARDLEALELDPISWLMQEEAEAPSDLDVFVQIESVETL